MASIDPSYDERNEMKQYDMIPDEWTWNTTEPLKSEKTSLNREHHEARVRVKK